MLNEFQIELIKCIESGSLEGVKKLVLGKFDIDKPLIPNLEIPVKIPSQRIPFPFVRGPTPLVFSILYQRTDIFKYFLIEKNASLDVKVNGLYPIHYACAVGKLDIMQIILGTEKGRSQVNLPNDYFYTPLHLAAANSNLQVVLLLLSYGSQVNLSASTQKPETKNSPLHVAMCNTDTQVVEALLSKGADLNALNAENETPMKTAEFFHNEQMVKFLQNYQNGTTTIRSFEILCKEYLDENTESNESEKIKQMAEQIRILKSKIENLEAMKQ
ncbi:histone-lysine N-methyltransferase family [Trichomonas vaginalis G3]|nr:histone-lysine N-methyltransferase family [Trichomonas vaginalis G3]KAI5488673.1 histone-lysine N-methyltransferase family [Trichomonas vaginalis G3]